MRRPLTLALVVLSSAVLLVTAPASATFLGENGRIAYVTDIDGYLAIHSIEPDGSDAQPLIDLADRDAFDPSWSAAGRLAFAAEVAPGGQTAIFSANWDGSAIEQLTSPPSGEEDSHPSWSPDSGQIAFARRSAVGVSRVLIVDVATGATRAASSGLADATDPAWAPDGRSVIASARTSTANPCNLLDCHFVLFSIDPTGERSPERLGGSLDSFDADWSPIGRLVTSTVSLLPHPQGQTIQFFDPESREVLDWLLGYGAVFSPSSSPEADYLAFSAFSEYDENAENPQLVVAPFTDLSNAGVYIADHAWGAAWSPLPDFDPPVIEFTDITPATEWVAEPRVSLSFEDPAGLASYGCEVDGETVPLTDVIGFPQTTVVGGTLPLGADGAHEIRCWAEDRAGNLGEVTRTLGVDTTAPIVGAPSVLPTIVFEGSAPFVEADVFEDRSGLCCATSWLEPTVGGGRFVPLQLTGETAAGRLPDDLPPDIWEVEVEVLNGAGGVARSSRASFVVIDPAAGAHGRGRIVPGGSDSEDGDLLPRLDGKSFASFDLSVAYDGVTPSGSLVFNYGRGGFKLRSRSLDWIVITPGDRGYFQGSGAIEGHKGLFPFRVSLTVPPIGPGRFMLEVFDQGVDPATSQAVYQASGGVFAGSIAFTR